MADQNTDSGIKFDDLTPEQQEAYLPRGEFKDPSLLDQNSAPAGAPGPLAVDDDSAGDPAPVFGDNSPQPRKSAKKAAASEEDEPKTTRKRTT